MKHPASETSVVILTGDSAVPEQGTAVTDDGIEVSVSCVIEVRRGDVFTVEAVQKSYTGCLDRSLCADLILNDELVGNSVLNEFDTTFELKASPIHGAHPPLVFSGATGVIRVQWYDCRIDDMWQSWKDPPSQPHSSHDAPIHALEVTLLGEMKADYVFRYRCID